MRENSITYTILKRLAEFGMGQLDAFFPKNYPEAALWRPLLGLDRKKKVKKQTISTMLWRLQQQGLVERIGAKKTAQWRITPKGRATLRRQKTPRRQMTKLDGVMRLVIFDIPEQERRKRDVIRAELVGCRFQPLQKSVWIGHCPLPQDFITMIDTLKLHNKIHIFSVRDQGTLRQTKKIK
ncbi:MAG: hypothetical protein HY617_02700 [Candidatus Sungbacteria bacterium]|nr:hypothetical protein [Candidatus Sungbacteria bacterium]